MATLTLGKSVTVDAVQSKKGDSVFVERRRKIIAPSDKNLYEEKIKQNESEERLRAILEVAKKREEDRKKREEEERQLRIAREQEIEKENIKYENVKEPINSKENKDIQNNINILKKNSVYKEDLDDVKNKSNVVKKNFKKTGKISLRDIIIGDDEDGEIGIRDTVHRRSEASLKRFREKAKNVFKAPTKVSHEIVLNGSITVKELANSLAEKSANVVKKLMEMGMIVSINQFIDIDTAELVASEFGAIVKRVDTVPYREILEREPDLNKLKKRSPIVTIVGHVDHGKTSLLDAFRNSNVVARESGGITQHVSSYEVQAKNGDWITFIDTPGHETFTAMRARGAQLADIVILVVAGNDSIMPQTVEAINHIKAAKVPFIIAINKIDLPESNPNKVKTDLLQYEVQVEEMGGNIQCVEISALKKIGLDKLEEAILFQSELMDLKADFEMPAVGTVVEAKTEKGLGAVATILVNQGTLKIGDVFVVGETYGKVRGLIDSFGNKLKEIAPGKPVLVLGLESVPSAGDRLHVMNTDAQAREVALYNKNKSQKIVVKKSSLEELFAKREENQKIMLPLIVRADTKGSIEAIVDMLKKFDSEKAGIEILSYGIGQITEGDVRLAIASKGLIVAFNVRGDSVVRDMARNGGAEIRYYSVIYRITDEIKEILSGRLAPLKQEKIIGYADVLSIFTLSKGIKVAGSRMTEGSIKKDANIRLLRDNIVIYDGKIGTLKREKNEVKEVSNGNEFGLSFEKYNDLKEGDRIECYEIEEIKAQL